MRITRFLSAVIIMYINIFSGFSECYDHLSNPVYISCASRARFSPLTLSFSPLPLYLSIYLSISLPLSFYVPLWRNTDSIWAASGKLTCDACSSSRSVGDSTIPVDGWLVAALPRWKCDAIMALSYFLNPCTAMRQIIQPIR